MTSIVIGATAGLGRAIATELAKGGTALVLVSRDEGDLSAQASDLRLRYGVDVRTIRADIADADPTELLAQCIGPAGQADAVLLIAGMIDPDDLGVLPDAVANSLARVNFLGPMRLVNAIMARGLADTHIVVAGSIASIRPRGASCVYGAAKTALEFYLQALRHADPARPGALCCYRLGYLRTAMTFGQSLPLPSLAPEKAARIIVKKLGRDRGVVYLPGWWRWIALALRAIPWSVYRRLGLGRRNPEPERRKEP